MQQLGRICFTVDPRIDFASTLHDLAAATPLQGRDAGGPVRHASSDAAAHRSALSARPSGANIMVPISYLAALTSDTWTLEQVAAMGHSLQGLPDQIPPLDFLRLIHQYMRLQDNEALQQGPSAPFGTFTMLVTEAGQCDTLGDALRQFARSMQRLRPDLIANVRCGRGSLCLSITPRQMMTANAELESEIFAVTAHCAFRVLVNGPLMPVSVRAPRDGGYHGGIDGPSLMAWLGCDMTRSGSGVMLEYSFGDGDRRLAPRRHSAWAGQEMAHFRELFTHSSTPVEELDSAPPPISIVQRVEDLLRQSIFHEPAIAKQLGMSTASLRRRMTAAGTSFRAVIDLHRQQRVEALLHSPTPLADIAVEAGYSDLRSLRRACAKWFGTSPADLRRKNRARQMGGKVGGQMGDAPPSTVQAPISAPPSIAVRPVTDGTG